MFWLCDREVWCLVVLLNCSEDSRDRVGGNTMGEATNNLEAALRALHRDMSRL